MQIIKPLEIAGKIMSLISESKKYVVIVSPYYKMNYWVKLNRVIEEAKARKVAFFFFVRKGEWSSIAEVERIGYDPIEIENLHAKIYFNEKEAILTSMNLNVSSDNNSIDIGMITQTEKEFADVFAFYEDNIKSRSDLSKFEDNILDNGIGFANADEVKNGNSNLVEVDKIERKIEIDTYDYVLSRKYHLEKLKELIVNEYFSDRITLFEEKSNESKEGIIIIADFPIAGTTLSVSGIIDINFSDSNIFNEFKNSSKDYLRSEIDTERVYWNRNVINIYGAKGFEFPLTEQGMNEKAAHFFEVIKKVSKRLIVAKSLI
jgi:hypothetical protein